MPLDRGEVLFREGDPGDALYVIVEGEVAVQAEGPPRVEMARLGPGSFIGEVALMTDQPRSATVTVARHSRAAAHRSRDARRACSRTTATCCRAVLRFVRDRLVDRWTRTSPLFRPFDDAARVELAARSSSSRSRPTRMLLGAGAQPDGLYIVLAGQFSVVAQRHGRSRRSGPAI